jgi:hypothetical protein
VALTLHELLNWVPEIAELAKQTRTVAANHANSSDFLKDLAKASTWEGRGGDAAREALVLTASHHDDAAQNLTLAALGMRRTELDAEALAGKIRGILNYANEAPYVLVDTLTDQVIPPDTTNVDKETVAKIQAKVTELRTQITGALAEGERIDTDLARAIGAAAGLSEPEGPTPSSWETPLPPPNSERTANQTDAFKEFYGREPVSANDWQMAAASDPHSYDPKNFGVPPEIVAGRFTPQPGKGVVQTNLFIPTDQVRNTSKDLTDIETGRFFPMNFGDNRGPSATADVEASRVSMFVDYDHGVIVVRQNPTVNVDGERGGALAATPDVHVVQARDGRVTVDYDAYDAYENPVGKALGITVNGRVTLSPQADGTVAVGGNTTIYPSMETYQYRDGLPAAQLQWDPANSGSEYGPGTSLLRRHWVGDATISPVRPDMPVWKWELESALPFTGDPFTEHTTQLTNPAESIPTVGIGR